MQRRMKSVLEMEMLKVFTAQQHCWMIPHTVRLSFTARVQPVHMPGIAYYMNTEYKYCWCFLNVFLRNPPEDE